MEQRRNPLQPLSQSRDGRGGFTLIEMVVAIVVLGVITAMVSVNWASFMRHQELRQDAINMHKDVMTLKARAIENGYTDTLRGTGNQYTIKWFVPDTANADSCHLVTKTFTLNSDVVIGIGTDSSMAPLGELPTIPSNGWIGNASTVKIVVKPDNINAYDSIYANGRIVLSRPKVNARYCIQKDSTNIKPELYHQSRIGVAWKRI